ncbi:pentatricopeptide repeat-containing protein At5g57250, mitochondrial-like [Tasmannia lanceolata]|uniref:pentatricopeptide repeat-containing protein At5g57250, mitochondrial-like n=1 Tax=Tasmannia lanceolata TaxID=3420 RepID=UPI00406422BA
MIFPVLFTQRCFSSSPSSYSPNPIKTLTLQNLLKRGFSPTLQNLNLFLRFLSRNHRFKSVLHIFSQMSSNKIKANSITYSIISWALLKENKFHETEQFFAEMRREGFVPQKGLYNYLIQGFCHEEKDPEKAFSILKECIQNHGISPSPFSYYSLVYCFSSLGKMDRAIEVLELMTEEKIGNPSNNFICSSIISGFCRIGKPELALGFYDNAEKSGTFRPSIVTYTAVVDALCTEGRVKEVCDLVCKMEREGLVLDTVFYSSWICGYVREGILAEAFRKHRLMVENGIKPDCFSYTILIDGFCKEGSVERAIGFLHEMGKDWLEPNLVTYTAIMRGFCKRGKLDEAFDVFVKIEELGVRADEITYATLIDGLCRKGDLDRVFGLLEKMEEKGISAGIVTYNTVISGLCKVGRTCEADEISNGIYGDNFTYSTLMHGYIRDMNVMGMLETKRRLEESGICMDVVTCNVLIKALFMLGQYEDACMLFKQMPNIGLVADSFTYCIMIDGYCRLGRIDEALEIFDEYRRTALASSVVIYNCIIGGLCREGMVEMAVEVFSELTEKGLAPDATIYMTMINSKFMEGNEEGVLKFLQGIEKLEAGIHSVICNGAISILCKKSCFEAALNVYIVMRRKRMAVTSESYYLILKGLICYGNKQLVQLLMNACIKEYGILETLVRKIIVRYVCKKDVKKVRRFLNYMGEKSICISDLTAIVNALTKGGQAHDALKLIVEAESNGMVVDVVAYSFLVDGLCKEGYLNKALDLCARMRNKGICPNIVTYNSVINGLCQQGCIVEAFRLFDSLEENNMFPTIITYATLIGALSKEGFLADANDLFQRMVLKGLSPNTRVYNLLINGHCRFGLMDDALKLVHDMERSCLEPDAFTVSAVINGCCLQGDLEAALGFFGEYQRRGVLPDLLGFINLIKGLCSKGRMEEARTILREMLQSQSATELINKAGDEINTDSLTRFLCFLCEEGNIQEATNVLNEVGSMIFRFGRSYGNSGFTKHEKLYERGPLGTSGGALDPGMVGTRQKAEILPRNIDSSLGCKFTIAEKANFSLSKVGKEDCEMQNYTQFNRNSPSHDFDACYSIIESLCSKGELKQANRAIKEMLFRTEEQC